MTGNEVIDELSAALIGLDIDESDTELIKEIAMTLIDLHILDGDAR
jgi:hypothetical protein